MATNYISSHFGLRRTHAADVAREATRLLVPVGRVLLAALFVIASFGHFSQATIHYAAQQGVPLANVAVPVSGVIALIGGLSVALGYQTRIGAALLALFLVPVTLMMHKFWGLADPHQAEMQQIMFMKNVAILGGVLLLAYFGGGPFSLDARRPKRRW